MHPLAHALTGALIGHLAPSPALGLLGGTASHVLLDLVPHTEWRTFGGPPGGQDGQIADGWTGAGERQHLGVEHLEAAAELCLAVLALWWLGGRCGSARLPHLLLGALGGVLPDLIDVPVQILLGWRPLLHVKALHRTARRDQALMGLLTQIVTIAAAGIGLWLTSGCR